MRALLARTLTRRLDRGDDTDTGFALVTVIGSMFVLSLLVIAAVGAAAGALPQSKRAQDQAAAMAAAQAGVADLVTQVNLCRDYWVNPRACAPNDLPVPDAAGWTPVKVGTNAQTGRYRVRYLVTPEPLSVGGTSAQDGIIRAVTAPDGTVGRGVTRATTLPEHVQTGLVRAEVLGEARGRSRALTVDLRQPGFLRYIYYTDFESMNPALIVRRFPDRQYAHFVLPGYDGNGNLVQYTEFSNTRFRGIDPNTARGCQRYWYGADGGNTGTRPALSETFEGQSVGTQTFPVARPCDLQFTSTDVVNGPLHTNDAILLRNGATFTSPTTNTSWRNPPGTTPPPAETDTTVTWYRGVTSTDQPGPGQRPIYAAPVEMPWRSAETRTAAARGCLYTGATSVELLSTGRMRVFSPYSRNLSAECGGTAVTSGPTEVAGPRNGVVHVQHRARDPFWSTTSCPSKTLGVYPLSDGSGTDITKYDCREGDAFVQGVAGAPVTISAENDVVVTDDITYVRSTSRTNVVGLVAEGNVEVYHPVTCKTTVGSTKVCPEVGTYASGTSPGASGYRNMTTATADLTIEAAIISMANSFLVQNHDRGEHMGTITVRGGIYQRFRGPVGAVLDVSPGGATSTSTIPVGFRNKNYEHDRRMLNVPPPAFPAPTGAAWAVTHFAEQVA